eukprot:3311643-Amphidinium_carterae.1
MATDRHTPCARTQTHLPWTSNAHEPSVPIQEPSDPPLQERSPPPPTKDRNPSEHKHSLHALARCGQGGQEGPTR